MYDRGRGRLMQLKWMPLAYPAAAPGQLPSWRLTRTSGTDMIYGGECYPYTCGPGGPAGVGTWRAAKCSQTIALSAAAKKHHTEISQAA